MFVVWFFVKGEKVLEMRVCYKYIVYIIYIKKGRKWYADRCGKYIIYFIA